jgi:hypothetical protein
MLNHPNQPEQTEEEILSARSRRSRGRGRGFEDAIVKRLRKLGYDPKKKVLSGGNLAKPYDVGVRPFRLKIEAKRRMGEGIIIESKWLNKIAPKYVVVFAAGPRLGKDTKMCAISLGNKVDNLVELQIDGKSKKIGAFEGKFVVKRTKALGDLVLEVPFILVHNGRRFVVQDFEKYMQDNWAQFAHKGEKTDATEDRV